jgi:hypothetical protein
MSRRWSEGEDELLKTEPYCCDPSQDVAQALGRSRLDVIERRRALGLPGDARIGRDAKQEVACDGTISK